MLYIAFSIIIAIYVSICLNVCKGNSLRSVLWGFLIFSCSSYKGGVYVCAGMRGSSMERRSLKIKRGRIKIRGSVSIFYLKFFYFLFKI